MIIVDIAVLFLFISDSVMCSTFVYYVTHILLSKKPYEKALKYVLSAITGVLSLGFYLYIGYGKLGGISLKAVLSAVSFPAFLYFIVLLFDRIYKEKI